MKKELTFSTFDGTQLYMRQDVPDMPQGVVVIVHGLCEHQGRYSYVTRQLVEAGLAVFRFDHRGHGRSEGKRVYYEGFNEIVDDVNEAVKVAEAALPGLPLFVLGHSMGGYATALFGTKYPGRAKGILLSGALTRYNHRLMGDLPMAGDARTYFPNALGDGVCSDPAVVEAYIQDPYVEKEISIGLCNSLGEGIAWLKANAAAFVDPVLVMHGCDDGLVSEQDSREFFGEIASKDKGLVIYPRLYHEILNEPSRDEIIGDMLRWIDKRM